jgi:hypothetical protein
MFWQKYPSVIKNRDIGEKSAGIPPHSKRLATEAVAFNFAKHLECGGIPALSPMQAGQFSFCAS